MESGENLRYPGRKSHFGALKTVRRAFEQERPEGVLRSSIDEEQLTRGTTRSGRGMTGNEGESAWRRHIAR